MRAVAALSVSRVPFNNYLCIKSSTVYLPPCRDLISTVGEIKNSSDGTFVSREFKILGKAASSEERYGAEILTL